MENDFFDRYSGYSNIELLRIIEQSVNYQPKAVETARQILNTRNITDEEKAFVINELKQIREKEAVKKEKVDGFMRLVTGLVEPLINPQKKLDYSKWFYILCICMTLQYIVVVYKAVKYFAEFWSYGSYTFGAYETLEIVHLVYIPFLIYLLLKRKKWGWILTFFNSIFINISSIAGLFIFFKYIDFYNDDLVNFLFPVVYYSFMIYNLLKPEVKELFAIDSILQRKIIVYSTLISVITFGIFSIALVIG